MVFDLVATGFIIIFSLFMMKKGGVRAILSFSGLLISIVIAYMLYPVVTDYVYDTPLPENLEVIVGEALTIRGESEGWEAIDAMPDFVRNAIKLEANEAIDSILEAVAKSVTKVIIDVIIFVILIVLTKFALIFISGALNVTMKLPVLKQLNSLVGLLCGLVMSLVIVWRVVAATGVIAASNANVAVWIEGSEVVRIMSNMTPF